MIGQILRESLCLHYNPSKFISQNKYSRSKNNWTGRTRGLSKIEHCILLRSKVQRLKKTRLGNKNIAAITQKVEVIN